MRFFLKTITSLTFLVCLLGTTHSKSSTIEDSLLPTKDSTPKTPRCNLRALPSTQKDKGILGVSAAWRKKESSLDRPLSLAVPKGGQPGDLVILLLGTSGRPPKTPSGEWTFIDGISKASNGNCSLFAYYKNYEDIHPDDITAFQGGAKKFAAMLLVRGYEVSGWDFSKGTYRRYLSSGELKKCVARCRETASKKNLFKCPKRCVTYVKKGEKGSFTFPEVSSAADDLVIASAMFDDKIASLGLLGSGGEEEKELLFHQCGDDTMVIHSGKRVSKEPLRLHWQGDDSRTNIVYAIRMALSLREKPF